MNEYFEPLNPYRNHIGIGLLILGGLIVALVSVLLPDFPKIVVIFSGFPFLFAGLGVLYQELTRFFVILTILATIAVIILLQTTIPLW